MVSANGRELMRKIDPEQVKYPDEFSISTGWDAETLHGSIEELRW